jgi:PadR family transcriptional regulator, regulatory protein PadR
VGRCDDTDPGRGHRRCCEAADGTQRHLGRGRGALLEPAVLAALASSESHGYDLARAIEQMTEGQVVPDTGGLYRVLRRLEEDGDVVSCWEETAAGPQRRCYRLTESGRQLLGHWLGHLEDRRRSLDTLIAAVRGSSEQH